VAVLVGEDAIGRSVLVLEHSSAQIAQRLENFKDLTNAEVAATETVALQALSARRPL
jgi:hypothetical protein